MRARYAGIVGLTVFVVSAVVPVFAQLVPPATPPSPQVPRRQLDLAAQALAKIAMKPRVTCGMTVIPADPKVDPKAIKPVPDRGTKPSIRKVPPGACR